MAVVEGKPVKHVRMEQVSTPTIANTSAPSNNKHDEEPRRRVVTLEPSIHTFAGTSSTRRDRSDPVMITDALSDVRAK